MGYFLNIYALLVEGHSSGHILGLECIFEEQNLLM